MKKHSFSALFTIIIVFLLGGCSQEPIDPPDKVTQVESNPSHQEETSLKEKIDENANPSPTEETDTLPELTVHYINVGQADSTLLQFSDGGEDFTILIDAGNWNRTDVVNYLNKQNISDITIAIGTHPDADHIGQLDKVIAAFDVGEVWLSGNTSNSQTFQRLIHAIDQHNADYYEPRMGDEFEIGPLEIEVLYPETISENDNDESISLKLTYGDVRFIFTGDASTNDELNMLQSGMNLKGDILQLGHHGSSTSTHPRFLSEVNPAVAIYSAGVDNSYGHPHEEVVKRIVDSGIKLYGTNVHGTIIVTTDGNTYNVKTEKDGTITPTSKSNQEATDDSGEEQKPNSACIDVNSATAEELQEIIHIGPTRAAELIRLRPFRSIDELARIDGIGPARIKDIQSQNLACIGG